MMSALQQLCVELYAQGLEPSTSLLRARALSKPSLPQAIDAIRWWQQQDKSALLQRFQLANAVDDSNAKTVEPNTTAVLDPQAAINEALNRIAQVEQELSDIKQLLKGIQRDA